MCGPEWILWHYWQSILCMSTLLNYWLLQPQQHSTGKPQFPWLFQIFQVRGHPTFNAQELELELELKWFYKWQLNKNRKERSLQNYIQCESFFPNGYKFFNQILRAYCMFLFTLDYKFLFNYMQLWWSYAILSATTIICSKCPPSDEMHAGWSHLIWHIFVKDADNWIKICNTA